MPVRDLDADDYILLLTSRSQDIRVLKVDALETHLRRPRKTSCSGSRTCAGRALQYRFARGGFAAFRHLRFNRASPGVNQIRESVNSAGSQGGIKQIPLSRVQDGAVRFLREAERQEIVITRHGRPASVLIGLNPTMTSSINVAQPVFSTRVERAQPSRGPRRQAGTASCWRAPSFASGMGESDRCNSSIYRRCWFVDAQAGHFRYRLQRRWLQIMVQGTRHQRSPFRVGATTSSACALRPACNPNITPSASP